MSSRTESGRKEESKQKQCWEAGEPKSYAIYRYQLGRRNACLVVCRVRNGRDEGSDGVVSR